MPGTLQVVKVGGSLLSRPNLLDDLDRWRQTQAETRTIAILGGGAMIDAVRQWDRWRPADPATVHWQCIDLLAGSFAHLRAAMSSDERFADVEFIETARQWQPLQAWWASRRELPGESPSEASSDGSSAASPTLWWLNVPAVYHRGVAAPLPWDWQTTTDAIAWWLASQIRADRCVLLKNCDVDQAASPHTLIQQGILDPACRGLLGSKVPLVVQRLQGAV